MANPFALAAALARTASIQCPHCGLKKVVENKPVHHRVCPRCKKHYPDPIAAKQKKRR